MVLSSSRVVIIILAISLRCASPASGPARTAQASAPPLPQHRPVSPASCRCPRFSSEIERFCFRLSPQASGVVFQWVFSLSYLLLSAKAVLVAMYGGLDSSSGSALPTYMSSTVLNGPGPSLLFIYLATAVSTVTCGGAPTLLCR